MCDEINDPKVYGTLRYIIRRYDSDDNTVEICTLNGGTKYVPYVDILPAIATAWNGKYTFDGELILHYYVDENDCIISGVKIRIEKWEVNHMISEIA